MVLIKIYLSQNVFDGFWPSRGGFGALLEALWSSLKTLGRQGGLPGAYWGAKGVKREPMGLPREAKGTCRPN